MERIKEFFKKLNNSGVPIFVFQDPITKLPSITFTFFVISGIICLLATLDSIKAFAGINFGEIKDFFDMNCYVYTGRSLIKAIAGTNANTTSTTEENK